MYPAVYTKFHRARYFAEMSERFGNFFENKVLGKFWRGCVRCESRFYERIPPARSIHTAPSRCANTRLFLEKTKAWRLTAAGFSQSPNLVYYPRAHDTPPN